jgi:hypothetical protein
MLPEVTTDVAFIQTLIVYVPELYTIELKTRDELELTDIVSAVRVPLGAAVVFAVIVVLILLHAALSNCSLYVNKL